MNKPKIGIIGKGFVGSAVQHGFSPSVGCDAEVKVYDKDPLKSLNTIDETINNSDFVFVSVPTPSNHDGSADLTILERYKNNLSNIRDKIDNQDINFYIDFIINSLFEANKYFNDQEPWKKKDDTIRLNTIVYTTLEIVRKISYLLYPIIPQSSLNALKIFNLNENDINLTSIENNEFLSKGSKINKIDILFKKIDKNND